MSFMLLLWYILVRNLAFWIQKLRWNFSFIRRFYPKCQILSPPVERVFGGNSYFLEGALGMPSDFLHAHIFCTPPYTEQIPHSSLAPKIFWRPLLIARSWLGRQKYVKNDRFLDFSLILTLHMPLNGVWIKIFIKFYDILLISSLWWPFHCHHSP